MRNLLGTSLVVLALTACSDGPSFGPETDPTPTQQGAILAAASDLAALSMADTQGDTAGTAAFAFAFSAQGVLVTDPGTTSPGASGLEQVVARVASAPGQALPDGCEVVGTSSVVWNHCTDSNGTTMDGMISWSPGHVEVDLQATGDTGGLQFAYSISGSIATSGSAIQGELTVSINASGSGISFSEMLHSQIDVQLTDGCVSGGTLTVTASGSGTGARNAAVQVIWSACNMFRVRNA